MTEGEASYDGLEDELKVLGLTAKEADVYLRVLGRVKISSTELSEMTGMYNSQLHYVLGRLAEKGFVDVEYGKPILYRAVDPHLLAEAYKSKVMLVEKSLVDFSKTKRCEEMVPRERVARIIKEEHNVLLNGIRIIKDSKTELVGCAVSGFIGKLSDYIAKAAERGVKIYICTDSILSKLSKLERTSVRLWSYPSLLLIADSEAALVSGSTDRGKYDVALLTNQTQIVDYFLDGFYTRFWSGAKKLKDSRPLANARYTTMRFALDDVAAELREGRQCRVKITGIAKSDSSVRNITGMVESCVADPANARFHLVVKKEDGEIIRVGGRNAFEEDVRCKLIEML